MTRVLFLIDESSALAARVAEGTKPKAECFANALNALLSQLAAGPPIDVALVGYRLADDGKADVGCRWGGPLAGRQLVGTSELAAAPLAVENRVRKIPGPGGYGVTREESVRFPIWYVPLLGAPGPRRAALEFCRDLLIGKGGGDSGEAQVAAPVAGEDSPRPGIQGAGTASVPPLVIHLLGDLPDEEGFRAAHEVFSAVQWPGGPPLVFHAHLGSSSRVPSTAYPSGDQNLSPDLLRQAFRASSILPEPLVAGLRTAGVPLNPGARGLIYNARLVDLIRFLGLVKAYAAWANEAPAAIAAAAPGDSGGMPSHGEAVGRHACSPDAARRENMPPTEPEPSPVLAAHATLVAFVLDRSCQSPDASAADPKSAWRRLQDRANELIGQFARQAKGAIQAALLAYGTGPSGQSEVIGGSTDPAAGPSPGPTWLSLSELADRAIRVDEFTDQVSNGIGGLLTITRKRPVFFDLKPTPPASPAAAFAKIAEMLLQWTEAHPGAGAQPVVVHCTRGQFEPGALQEATAGLREAQRATLPLVLYHVVVTEAAHRSAAYPASPDGIESDGLRALWELTSPLAGGDALVGKRPGVSAGARGMVINAAFDALTDVVGGSL